MKINNHIVLDFNKENDLKVPSVQYDSGSRFVKIKLQQNKVPFDINGYRVTVVANKVDGTEIMNDCTILDGANGLVEFEITEQFNAVEGVVDCQLKLFKDEILLTSMPFSISVVKSVSTKEIVSSNELKTLVNALGEVQNIDNRFAQTNAQLSEISINVKTFGAKGDGVTDDTTAIQTAIDSIKEIGGTVFFPVGVYLCANIQLRSHVNIKGCGNNSILKLLPYATTKSINGSQIDTEGNYPGNVLATTLHHTGGEWYNQARALDENNTEYIVKNVVISDLQIDGNKDYNVTGDIGLNASAMQSCININQSYNVTVQNCKIVNARMDGIFVGYTLHGGSDNCTFLNLEISDCGRCGVAQITGKNNTFSFLKITNTGSTGIDIEANVKDEINYGHIVSNCYIDNKIASVCKTYAVQKNCIITGCTIVNGITLSDAITTGGTIISNNIFIDTTKTHHLINLLGANFKEDEKNQKEISFVNNKAYDFLSILPSITQGGHGFLKIEDNEIYSINGLTMFLPYKMTVKNNLINLFDTPTNESFVSIEFHHKNAVVNQGEVFISSNTIKSSSGSSFKTFIDIKHGAESPTFTNNQITIDNNRVELIFTENLIRAEYGYNLINNNFSHASKIKLMDGVVINGNEFNSDELIILTSAPGRLNGASIKNNLFNKCSLQLERPQNCIVKNNEFKDCSLNIIISFNSAGSGGCCYQYNTFIAESYDGIAITAVAGHDLYLDLMKDDYIIGNVVFGSYSSSISVGDGIATKFKQIYNNFN